MANRAKKTNIFTAIRTLYRHKKQARIEQILAEPDTRAVKVSTKQRAAFILALIMIFGFLGLIVRLGYINIVHGEEYEQKAITQQLSDKPVYAKRGSIYDRNGKTLATSVSAYTVYLSSAYIKDEEQRVVVAKGLSDILGADYNELYEMTGKKLQYQLVQRRITDDQAKKVRKLINDNKLNSIGLSEDYKRVYPYSTLLSQVLGFTGSDAQGLYGLEYYYDSYLTGVNGRAVTAQNAVGTDMEFSYETYIDAQDGYSLVLTVDEVIQSFLEKYLLQMYEEFGVADNVKGIIMDIKTGEVLGMAQYPNFDCNNPFEVDDQIVWRNGNISDGYEPGSTFKSLVSAMALEEGAANLNSHFYCSGSMNIAGETIHCHKTYGHGDEDFTQGLINSCNPVFMSLAEKLGTPVFCDYFTAFGLDKKTGIDLPGESVGISHDENKMGQVELAVSSFGQTFKVTPIQLLTAFCAAVNGGNLVTPHVVKEIVDSDGNVIESFGTTVKRQVVSESTSKTLCQMLEATISEGGSARNAYVTGYRVGGKTGTAEKTETRGQESGTEYVASMIAVAPADNPRIAMLILADNPKEISHSGGTVAGPAISGILSEILPYLGVDPVFSEEELANMEINTPHLIGTDIDSAKAQLEKKGLNADIRGSGSKVIGQMPASGTKIPKDGKVILYTDSEVQIRQTIVPAVTGLSPSQAALALSNAGLNVCFKGYTETDGVLRVYEQSIDPETTVDEGTVVTIYVRVETNDD